jgi:hypothetical protein
MSYNKIFKFMYIQKFCTRFATLNQKIHNIVPYIFILYHTEYSCIFRSTTDHHDGSKHVGIFSVI